MRSDVKLSMIYWVTMSTDNILGRLVEVNYAANAHRGH